MSQYAFADMKVDDPAPFKRRRAINQKRQSHKHRSMPRSIFPTCMAVVLGLKRRSIAALALAINVCRRIMNSQARFYKQVFVWPIFVVGSARNQIDPSMQATILYLDGHLVQGLPSCCLGFRV